MKQVYFLLLLCCLGYTGFGQTTTTIYSTGVAGSYTSATGTSTTRTDGNINCTSTTERGYAVFNLSAIPPGSTITSCIIGYYVITYGGSGTASGWDVYGYPGN